MPGGDRTRPAGMGPMTGRAVGYCAGYTLDDIKKRLDELEAQPQN